MSATALLLLPSSLLCRFASLGGRDGQAAPADRSRAERRRRTRRGSRRRAQSARRNARARSMPSRAPAWAPWSAACTPRACPPRRSRSCMRSVNWQDAFQDRPPREELGFRRKQDDREFLVRYALGVTRGGLRPAARPRAGAEARAGAAQRRVAGGAKSRTSIACRFRFARSRRISRPARPWCMDSGDLVTAMRASMSAPGVFAPARARWPAARRRRTGREPADRRGARDGRRRADRRRRQLSAVCARGADLAAGSHEPGVRDHDPRPHAASSARS